MKRFKVIMVSVLALCCVTFAGCFGDVDELTALKNKIDSLTNQINALQSMIDESGNINIENKMALTVSQVYKSMVSIRTSEGCGSGVVVHKTANYVYIATNYHVISGARSVGWPDKIMLLHWNENVMNGEYMESTFTVAYGGVQSLSTSLGYDQDFAIVRASASQYDSSDYANITVAERRDTAIAPGEKVIAMGWSLGTSTLITDGVAGFMLKDGGQFTGKALHTNLIRHNAEINPGNSGGGLFDINGKLIGLNTFTALTTWDVYMGDPARDWTWDETDFFALEAAAGMYYAINVSHVTAGLTALSLIV